MRTNAFVNVIYREANISIHTHVHTLNKKQDKVLMVMYAVAN